MVNFRIQKEKCVFNVILRKGILQGRKSRYKKYKSSTSLPLPTDYSLLRSLAERAAKKTRLLTHMNISVIMPYGFELIYFPDNLSEHQLTTWPLHSYRHYPVLGVYGNHARHETVANIFAAILLDLLNKDYHPLYENMAAMHLHGIGYYLTNRYKKIPEKYLNVISVQVVELGKPNMHVIDHYSNYVAALFGILPEFNLALPEYRDFEISLLRRNRLYQEYIMCEYIARAILPNLASLSTAEHQLFELLFKLMRKQNTLELLPNYQGKTIMVNPQERQLVNHLIQPRMKTIKAMLDAESSEWVSVESLPYYDGDKLLKTKLPIKQVNAIHELVKDTYYSFPERFKNYSF